eukprot:149523-Prymnesium_polylepis.1
MAIKKWSLRNSTPDTWTRTQVNTNTSEHNLVEHKRFHVRHAKYMRVVVRRNRPQRTQEPQPVDPSPLPA